jgi:outer membrane protein OmpU
MKKILLATTMLAGTAGFAAAEVAVSGYAEMGILGGANVGETQFHQDVEVTFSMSGETDSGLSFGTAIDLDETDVAFGDDSGTSVFVSGTFGKITMGDTDGGFDWALSETGMGTSMGDDHTSHVGYSGNSGLDGDQDGQVVRYEYSAGDLGVAASVELDDTGVDSPIVGLGVKYAVSGVNLGLGYQSDDFNTIMGVSVAGEMGAVKYAVNYSDLDTAGTHMGIGLGYTTGALMVAANYGVFEDTDGVTTDGYGLVANYDLGGGAVVMVGYGSEIAGDVDAGTVDGERYSIGLGLSF